MPQVPQPQQWPRGPKNSLHEAADYGFFETAAALLASDAFDIDLGEDEGGWTALMIASHRGYSLIVRMLLSKGAQVSIADVHGDSGLHLSVLAGHMAVTKTLVEAGAPLEVATKQLLCTPLHLAADNGCIESITTSLEADVPPLDMAAQNGHAEVVQELIRQHCRPRVGQLLVEAGADTTSAVPVSKHFGKDSVTPLGLTMRLLDGRSTYPLTEEQLKKLKAIRRLLLRVEAVHAVSWLWSTDISTITHSTAHGTDRTIATSTTGTPLMLMMRRRTKRREVPLSALLRWEVVVTWR
ncbi:EsV-1-199 [Ectocarpus siliculosus]|uniref:EsV-1-199 n=1 Tax=Ectocarpus siliculosus TaxID=2880 RepID=D7FSU4_ECTSI|nr:EsV-1-199 [Ectocarpus siliculosus]|eukprot:CBJ31235.1 EsV-1-199 [Ectocarpus siliculosus]